MRRGLTMFHKPVGISQLVLLNMGTKSGFVCLSLVGIIFRKEMKSFLGKMQLSALL